MIKLNIRPEIDKCLEYVEEENKPRFLQLMEEIEVSRSYVKHGIMKYWQDKTYRNIYRFTFRKNGHSASITYGDSVNNFDRDIQPSLYNILTTVGSEMSLYINCRDFNDFCDETGYDENDKNSKRVYEKLISNGEKLSKIFSENDVFILPN